MRQRRFLWIIMASLLLIATTWSLLLLQGLRPLTEDQRVQQIGSQLKCVVCQGESVADSQAGLAQEMRLIIREQVHAGKSDQEVIDYFVQRYGEEIAWLPSWQGFGLLSWLMPILFFVGGFALLIFLVREWLANAHVQSQVKQTPDQNSETQNDDVWRALLEEELAADDVLFRSPKKGAI